ncbi:MAG: HAD-IC family P-type ATPase, partial [Actinomycetota bacterium]
MSTTTILDGQKPHTLAISAVVDHVGSDLDHGLSSATVAERLTSFGPNKLAEAKRDPAWKRFLNQFRDVLIMILFVAAIVSFVVSGELKTPIVVLVVVLVNALIGFIQENRAEASLDALKKMLTSSARVRRDGQVMAVPTENLVPGDLVLVEAGDRIPADGRLTLAANLEIEEAALTGESTPAEKSTDTVTDPDAPLGDRSNMTFMNTVVTRGRGE